MPWQDVLISLGGVFFAVALIPSLLSSDKPALQTSVITAAILFMMIFTYASLNLWLSAAMNSIMCVMWATLGIQKYRLNKAK